MSITEILEAIPTLSPEELAQVKTLLDTLPSAPSPQMTEEEFARHLAAKGIVTLPSRMTDEDIADFNDYKPIEVKGTPLSQMIIEERGVDLGIAERQS